jgi:hypothetical protein
MELKIVGGYNIISPKSTMASNNFAPISPQVAALSSTQTIAARGSYEPVWVTFSSYPHTSPIGPQNENDDWRYINENYKSNGVLSERDYTNENTYITAGSRFRKINARMRSGEWRTIAIREHKGLKEEIGHTKARMTRWTETHGADIRDVDWLVLQEYYRNTNGTIIVSVPQMRIPLPQRVIKTEIIQQYGAKPARRFYWGTRTDSSIVEARHGFIVNDRYIFYYSEFKTELTPTRAITDTTIHAFALSHNASFFRVGEDGSVRQGSQHAFMDFQLALPMDTTLLVQRRWTEVDGHLEGNIIEEVTHKRQLCDISSKLVSEFLPKEGNYLESDGYYVRNTALTTTAIGRYEFKRAIAEEALSPKRVAWKLEQYGEVE